MRLSGLIGLLIATLFLSACATLNKNECLSADWQMIGYEDGTNGASSMRLQKHREACAKHSVTPDFNSYQSGYDEGIQRFCTDRVGFTKGKSGFKYAGQCPANLEAGFLKGYDLGREFYVLNQGIRSRENNIRLKEQQIEDLEAEIQSLEDELFADATTTERRREVSRLKDEKLVELTILETDLLDMQLDIAKAEGELKQLELRSPY